MERSRFIRSSLSALLALGVAASPAFGQAVINNGTGVTLGVDAAGQLNIPGSASEGGTSSVGLRYNNWESTAPGCLCEGWGAGISGGTFNAGAWIGANNAQGGFQSHDGFSHTLTSFTSTASTAVSVVQLGNYMEVKHDFKPSISGNLYQVDVTITNLSTSETLGSGTDGIRYRRLMDWDIEPTAFNEYVLLEGWGASNLIGMSNDGFQSPNPFSSRVGTVATPVQDQDVVWHGPDDHGALFDFAFGALAPSSFLTFTIFYGGAGTIADMQSALAAVGAEVYSMGACNPTASSFDACADSGSGAPAVHAFGFEGVGGTGTGSEPPPPPPGSTVPEPTTMILLGSGLLGLGGLRRRRQTVEA